MKHFLFLLISFLFVFSPQKVAALQSHSNLVLTPDNGICNLDWNTIAGRTYFLQYSFDLGIWHYLPEIIDGDGYPTGHWFSCGAEEVYLRLQYTDLPTGGDSYEADFDNDGYSNYSEIMAGTSPFVFTVGDQNPDGGNGDQQLPDYPTPEGAAYKLNIDISEPETPQRRIQIALTDGFEVLSQNGMESDLSGREHKFPVRLPTGSDEISIKIQLEALKSEPGERKLALLLEEVSQPENDSEDLVTLDIIDLTIPGGQTSSNTHTIDTVLPGTNPLRSLLPVEIKVYRPEVLKGAIPWTLNRDEKVIPQEEMDEKGVGIRVNQDDDNGNSIGDSAEVGAVNGENDLIEIEFKNPQLPEGFDLVIKKSPILKVWGNKDKSNLVAGAGNEAVVPENLKPPRSYWVESIVDLKDGELEFLLRPKNGGADASLYKIPFYTYKTFLIGLSGETFDHQGNVVGQAQANGVYEISEKLYLSGYNIGYYDEDIVANNGDGTAYDEASQQVKTCFVKELGIFGHSHGGGSTHDLSKKLDDDRGGIGQFTIPFTGYIDAIDQRFPFINAETRFPPSAGHLLNYYQRDSALDGFSVVGADNHNVTHWGLGHGGIDNDARVVGAIEGRAKAKIKP